MLAASAGLSACDETQYLTGPVEPDLPGRGRLSLAVPRDTLFSADSLSDTLRLRPVFTSTPGGRVTDLPGTGVRWTSSDPTVAVVDSTGLVSSRGAGTTTILAEASGQDAKAVLTVVRVPYSIVATPTSISGVVGDSARISPRALFDTETPVPGVRFIYMSSAPAVATVDTAGLVRLVGAGTATITVRDPGQTAPATVTVTSFARVVGVASSGAVGVQGALDVGSDHSCGIIGPGRLYCWGRGDQGQLGVTGDSVCFEATTQPAVRCELSPKRAAPTLTFTAVSAGDSFSCGIVVGGAGYCWGNDTVGQLGIGRTAAQSVPALVTGLVRFASISAGDLHACGIALAGGAYCWGFDLYGQLGDVSPQRPVNSTTPIPVVDANQQPLPLTQVSGGRFHSCGRTAAGQAYCWGFNAFGQLGNGGTSTPPPIAGPSVVAGGLVFTSIVAGGNHTCGLVAGGAAYCWGDNASGQLGTGALGGSSATPTPVAGGLAFTQIATGADHTCGITAAGSAYCWGNNNSNRVGPIDPANVATPTLVAGGHTFASVSAGLRHSCGVVLAPATEAGTWCWGGNLFGALGNRLQAASRGTPVKADPLS